MLLPHATRSSSGVKDERVVLVGLVCTFVFFWYGTASSLGGHDRALPLPAVGFVTSKQPPYMPAGQVCVCVFVVIEEVILELSACTTNRSYLDTKWCVCDMNHTVNWTK